jgi:DNA-binding transcriptional MocR family regulator
MERVELCSNRCCPTISKEGDNWIITDDYDGEIRLTTEELENLIRLKKDYEATIDDRLPVQS